jgi:glycosyltransferase involved in cell wall biosynthesis
VSLRFSIVTPSYNQLDWLRLCAASVSDQQGVPLEHIVQDAGTGPEFDAWAKTQPALKYYVEKDKGMYDAVNRGFARATGELFAYLNCDEQYLPGTLGRVSAFLASQPKVDVLFGDVLIVDRTGKAVSYRRAIPPKAHHIRLSHLNTSTCATFLRKRVFDQGHRFDPEWKSIGDAVWIYKILKAGLRVAVLPELLSVFTLTGANLSTHDVVSEREKQKWLAQADAPAPIFRWWHVALHRGAKLVAGAYRKRSFDYEIFTIASPRRRVRFCAHRLGGKWKATL